MNLDRYHRAPLRVAAGLLAVGVVFALLIGGLLPRWWIEYFEGLYGEYDPLYPFGCRGLRMPEVLGSLRLMTLAIVGLGAVAGWSILWGLYTRSRWALFWTQAAFICAYIALFMAWFGYFGFLDAREGGNLFAAISQHNAEFNTDLTPPFGMMGRDYFESWNTGIAVLLGLALVVGHVACATSVVYRHHGVELVGPAPGDRIREFVRIGGRDRPWANSVYSSLFGHILILILPLLLSLLHSCGRERYELPGGRGRPAAPPVTAPKIVKKKRFVLAKESIYIFSTPHPNDSKVVKNIDQISQNTYVATASGTPGAMGDGDGDEGGFGGPPGGFLRFIRLKWNCRNHHDGNSRRRGNADKNFMQWYKNNPAVKFKVAPMSEERSIMQLRNFEPGYEPPFVYMTGEDQGRVTSGEVEVLKQYLKNGGMLVVDAGSQRFHGWFVRWVRNLTGGKSLVEISDDDPIFQVPYGLDNIDPLYNHSGKKGARAQGWKYQGRWCIFYHPGDMNDAWKDGNTSAKRIRENARFVMYNVIYYAIIKYKEVNREHYKK